MKLQKGTRTTENTENLIVIKKRKNTEYTEKNKMEINELTEKVIGCAIEVHKSLGPGLLEAAYEQCLAKELNLKGIKFETQAPLPIKYKGMELECGYRVDFLIEKVLIIELKSLEKILDIHKAQILTYMKLSSIKVGLLINFNVKLLKNGIQRFVL
jgi:GxxExxY protein